MKSQHSSSLLDAIDTPQDLRQLAVEQLPALAAELRAFLIQSISSCGGHFSSGLGTVELAVALHYVFHTPVDKLIWDVGHQAYPHKILTGRRDVIGSIRQRCGLTPFCKRSESEYDPFGAGHSSTSISAAVGMAMAARARGLEQAAIAVIGDGAITAGMAYEAMNHAGTLADLNLLVVLNDNKMSISENVGALNRYTAELIRQQTFRVLAGEKRSTREKIEFLLESLDDAPAAVEPGSFFRDLGFAYSGPIDGHDLHALLDNFRALKAHRGPRLLHVVTCKGNGYEPAECEPIKYHGVSRFDAVAGIVPKPAIASAAPPAPSYSQIFGDWLCDMAASDERVVGITPAMREGSGMVDFAERFPERYVDVGIAEQHSVTVAAGMATEGLRPVVAIYSSFLQRAYDQVVHDVVIQKLPVLFAIDRAGLVGPDGPTHAGSYDFTFLRSLPDMVVMAPADENECRQMLSTGIALEGPSAVRYPRGSGPGAVVERQLGTLPLGKAQLRRRGQQVALLAFGSMVAVAESVAQTLDATLVNMRFVKPLDEDMIAHIADDHDVIVTLEENVVAGGAGVAVYEYLASAGIVMPMLHLGLPDRFIEHGTREEMLADAGLDAESIEARIDAFLDRSLPDRQPEASRVVISSAR